MELGGGQLGGVAAGSQPCFPHQGQASGLTPGSQHPETLATLGLGGVPEEGEAQSSCFSCLPGWAGSEMQQFCLKFLSAGM